MLWSVLAVPTDDPDADPLQQFCDAFEIGPEDLLAELRDFAEQCFARGLFVAGGARSAVKPYRSATAVSRAAVGSMTLLAFRCLLATSRSLNSHGFAATYEDCGNCVATRSPPSLETALRKFRRAEQFVILRRAPNDCLARSLALFRYLRLLGFPVGHVIGIRRLPFAAHAWVEHKGSPVLDAFAHGFAPIARIGSQPATPQGSP